MSGIKKENVADGLPTRRKTKTFRGILVSAARISAAAALLAAFCFLSVGGAQPNTTPYDLVKQGRSDTAAHGLMELIEQNPNNPDLRLNLAEIYIMSENFEQAEKMLLEVIRLQPRNPIAWTDLGLVRGARGRYPEAIEAHTKAIEIDPGNPTVYNNLAQAYLHLNRREDADRSFRKSILININLYLVEKSKLPRGLAPEAGTPSLTPEQVGQLTYYLENLAIAYAGLKNYEKSARYIEEAVSMDPENELLKTKLDMARQEMSDTAPVENAQLTSDLPGAETPEEANARQLLSDGKYAEAAALYESILASGRDGANLRTNLGVAYDLDGKHEEALPHHLAAVRLFPTHPTARNNLGYCYETLGRVDDAIETYRKAVEVSPDSATAYNNLGHGLEAKGDLDAAMENYRIAIGKDPRFATAHENLASALMRKGDADGAVAQYGEALKLNPRNVVTYNNLALAHYKKGNYDATLSALLDALDVEPNSEMVMKNMVMVKDSIIKREIARAEGEAANAEATRTVAIKPPRIPAKPRPAPKARPARTKPADEFTQVELTGSATAEFKNIKKETIVAAKAEKPSAKKPKPAKVVAVKPPDEMVTVELAGTQQVEFKKSQVVRKTEIAAASAKKPTPKVEKKRVVAVAPRPTPVIPPVAPGYDTAPPIRVPINPLPLPSNQVAVSMGNNLSAYGVGAPSATRLFGETAELRKELVGVALFQDADGRMWGRRPSTGLQIPMGSGVEPHWSPNGDRIAFIAVNGFNIDIEMRKFDGGDATVIYSDGKLKKSLDFSPDGNFIAVVQGAPGGSNAIRVVGVADRKGKEYLAEWSPQYVTWDADSKHVFFRGAKCPSAGGRSCLGRFELATKKVEWFPETFPGDGGAALSGLVRPVVTVSPDGKTLLFYSQSSPSDAIILLDRDSGAARKISILDVTKKSIPGESFSWTSDGRHIAFNHENGLWAAPLSGSGAFPLVVDMAIDSASDWMLPDKLPQKKAVSKKRGGR